MRSTTPTVVEQIVETEAERSFWEVVRHHERPPFFHAEEGVNNRLNKAARVVYEERITPNSDGSYTVEGSEKRMYRCAESCSCPYSQKSKSKWCYHLVAVALYVEWQRRLRPVAPVDLGTLRPGTLPLPPVTVEERLAQAPADPPLPLIAPREEGPVYTTSDGTRYTLESRPYLQPTDATEAQGDAMSDDAAPYMPTPTDTTTAPLEPPDTTAATPRPLPGPVLLPSLDARSLEASMQAWAEQRQVVKRFIQTQLVDGTDYYTLQMGQRSSKPTLSKAGSEKFLGLFQLHAIFAQDTATWTMLGEPKGTLCYVCHLLTRTGEVVSEGRGARDVLKEKDINKAIKMAQKSAQIDAVLRTGALSEAFTQDINDADDEPATPVTPATLTRADLRKRIWAMVQAQAPEVKTREAVEAWVHQETGYTLEPDHYRDILESLHTRA